MKLKLILLLLSLINTVYAQVKIKMKNQDGISIIQSKVNGLPLNFIFDTGATDVSLSLTEVSFMLKNGYLKDEDFGGEENYLDANGEVREGFTVILRKIEIGGIIINDVKANIVKNIKAPLLLGQSALRKLGKIEINFDEQIITIYQNKNNELVEDSTTYKHDIEVDTSTNYKPKLSKDEEYFNLGLNKYNEGEYDEAIIYYNKAINLNNKNLNYVLNRAIAKEVSGDKKKALIDYNFYLSQCTDDATVYGYRGELKYSIGDTLGAISDLNLSIKYNPKNEYAFVELAKINFDKNSYLSCIAYLDKAIIIDTSDCYNYKLRGLAYFHLNKFNASLSDFNTSLFYCPKDAFSLTMRGAVRSELKEYLKASQDITEALKIDSSLALANRYMGVVFEKYDKLETALEYYKKAVALDSNDLFSAVKIVFLEDEIKSKIWISLYQEDGEEIFMKKDFESKEYNIITLWLKLNKKKYTKKVNGKEITYANSSSLQLVMIDCSKNQMSIERTIIYDSKNNVIDSRESPYSDFKYYPPNSKGSIIISNVCKRF